MSLNLQKDHPPIEGSWWNPSGAATKLHGVLTLKATKHATLRLVEYRSSLLQPEINKLPKTQKVIHGLTKEGQAVTLVNCFTYRHRQTGGAQEVQLGVEHVIFGHHFSETDLVFDEIHIEFDCLDHWITYSRFEAKAVSEQENQKEIRIRLNQDNQIPFQAPGYAASKFYIGYRSSESAFKFSIQSRANLQIAYSIGQTLEAILKDVNQWEWFLTLATAHKAHLKSLSLSTGNTQSAFVSRPIKERHDTWIATSKRKKNGKSPDPQEMTFTLPDIQGRLSQVISDWKSIQRPWAAVLHRYFATIHRRGIQLEEQFLFRAQAIEAMHRTAENGSKVNQRKAYAAAWEETLPLLKKKLGEKDVFVETMCINRNYLTHYNPDDESKALDFTELFMLTQKLGFLLEAAILKKIGMPLPIIERAIGSRRWGYLVRYEEDD